MKRYSVLPWLLAAAAGSSGGAFAQSAPADAVRYLAANCANCHGTLGKSVGSMPSLAGQPAPYISEQMRAFRDGRRTATIMHQLAKGYTDEQIDALAGYFSRLAK